MKTVFYPTADACLEAVEEAFMARHGSVMRQALSPDYLDALARLGHPEKRLPPTFHVAGTNGKGSTCAFLRALLEAAGYSVHVSTSPHLVRVHERIRLSGTLVSEDLLLQTLTAICDVVPLGLISYFEILTIAAFILFRDHPADFAIMEVGLGGRLDASNVIEQPLASLITRLSYDHCKFLGSTLSQIAGEKAGIMKTGAPCFAAAQSDATATATLQDCANAKGVGLYLGGRDWHLSLKDDGFVYRDSRGQLDLPRPRLLGAHQCQNAGLAIAALRGLGVEKVNPDHIRKGLALAEWPGRLQDLSKTGWVQFLPAGAELWLDGGHNDSCGEVIAEQLRQWRIAEPSRPVHVVIGMLTTKKPSDVVTPMLPYVASWTAVPMLYKPIAFEADVLAHELRQTGARYVASAPSIEAALSSVTAGAGAPRVLIFGSLYLAGEVLEKTGLSVR